MEEKRALRKRCFAAVKALGLERKAGCSAEICEHLRGWSSFSGAISVGVYIAVGSEPNLDSLIFGCPEKKFSLAGIGRDGGLVFRQIKSREDLMIGDFGIAEPDPERCPLVDESEIDLVLVPGVGFDPRDGSRLGRGKGHYDRFLERFRDETRERDSSVKRQVAGVSFSIQQVELKPEPHDQPMDFLISESGIRRCR